MRVIETERLQLVPVRSDGADTLWEMLQRSDLREYQDLPDIDRAQFRRIVANRPMRLVPHALGRFEWFIYEGDAHEPSGWVSLRMQERDGRGEVGYSVVSERRGNGVATEALRALVREGFDRAHLQTIRAFCVPENSSSRRVLQNVGFAEDGLLRNGATVAGRSVDVLTYVLERSRAPA